jgi:two-component system, chemotaxis family, chemotaxis protein CheY
VVSSYCEDALIMNILVADDDHVSQKKMEIILRPFGTVHCVESGAEAITVFVKAWENWNPFDLVTLDISMPGMNGQEALKQLRAVETEKKVPADKRAKVMMVTGVADRDTVKFCKIDGCDEYVVKPFTRTVVIEKMRNMGLSTRMRGAW